MFKLAVFLSAGYAILELAVIFFGISTPSEAYSAWINYTLGVANFAVLWKYVWK